MVEAATAVMGQMLIVMAQQALLEVWRFLFLQQYQLPITAQLVAVVVVAVAAIAPITFITMANITNRLI